MRTPDLQLFHDVFSASPIGIVVENVDGQPLFVNPAFCGFLGFTEEELHSKHCVDFSPPEDAGRDWVLFQQLRAGSIGHYQLEKRYFRRDGSLVWGRLSISLLNGHPSPLVLAMVEDITDKKNAEEARFRLAAVVESSDDAIASVALDGLIASWNRGAQKLYGYTEAEAVGKPVSMLVPPELPDEENKLLEAVKGGERIEQFETVRVTKTGRRIKVSLTLSPIKDSSGKTVGCSRVARDITERKLAEEAIRASEELLKIFVKHVPAAVAMLDCDMRYLQVSDRWCADFSLNSWHVLGRSHYEMFPDIPDRWKQVHRRALAGETVRAEEDPWDREEGTTWLRWEIRPWQNRDGVQGGILIFSEDITDRKNAEQELRGMSRKLIEAHEQERTRIGRELHDDVVQRLALLAAGLWKLEENPAEVRRHVRELRERTTELSDDVQALSHELHSSKVEYLGAIAGMKSWCKEFGQRQGIEIDFQSPQATVSLPTEMGLCLFRVLQEALHNASKHSGVRRIEVQLREDSGQIHLLVSDLGKGFELETAMQGHGLGLTSMQERVRLVNGTIEIHSKPMAGTTVHARVPLNRGDDSMRAAG